MSAWEKNVRRVTPYVPGEQPREAGFIKLNTNENPYPPPTAVVEAIRAASEDLQRASQRRHWPVTWTYVVLNFSQCKVENIF